MHQLYKLYLYYTGSYDGADMRILPWGHPKEGVSPDEDVTPYEAVSPMVNHQCEADTPYEASSTYKAALG